MGAAREGNWEKADVRESKQEARVNIFLFLQIDLGILEATKYNPLAYAYSIISTFFFSGKLEIFLKTIELFIFTLR